MSDIPMDERLRGKKPVIPIDTLALTESLGVQTFRRGSRRPWSKSEDELLLLRLEKRHPVAFARKTLESKDVDWDAIAAEFPPGLRKSKDCRKRWLSLLDPNLRRGKWLAEEDKLLLALYDKHGAQWQLVAADICGRTEHQCSKRYMEVLDPALRDRLRAWTEEEDLLLIRQVRKNGTKWRTVAKALEGRPSLTCRNRWRNLLTAVARGRADRVVEEEIAMARREAATAGSEGEDESDDGGASDTAADKVEAKTGKPKPSKVDRAKATSAALTTIASMNAGTGGPPDDTSVEWRYSLSPGVPDSATAPTIASQELAQFLVHYAAEQGMTITVHQHIHHHHQPAPFARQTTAERLMVREPRTFEPELTRFQHFNYLPPLTEVPRLSSSASSPASSSKGSTHHHHHHHHYHHQDHQDKGLAQSRDSNIREFQYQEPHPRQQQELHPRQHQETHPRQHQESYPGQHQESHPGQVRFGHELRDLARDPQPMGFPEIRSYSPDYKEYKGRKEFKSYPKDFLEDEAASKESDLLKLLNEADERAKSPSVPLSNLLTPLTKAVQMVAAAEDLKREEYGAPDNIKREEYGAPDNLKRAGEFGLPDHKRAHADIEDDEEGLDFFETMRHLSGPRQARHPQVDRARQLLPVSQHHPLHHASISSSVTPQPEKIPDEEGDEDLMDAYGFYTAYTRERYMEQLELDTSAFVAIPFNPS